MWFMSWPVAPVLLSTYGVLRLMGVDPSGPSTVPSSGAPSKSTSTWDTTPFFSMMRYCAFPLGMGLAMTSGLYKKVMAVDFSWKMRVVAAVLAVSAGKASEWVALPKTDVPVFYASAFIFNALLAATMFGVVPCVVASLSGRLGKVKSN
uniref:Uncharacterized protein n=1 Tax=Ixodes scapularis TaxID=6945 RepID=A0A4D5S566_IXOSC